MKHLTVAALFSTALLSAFPIDDSQIAESVVVRNSEIYVRYAGSATEHKLTSDGKPKASPVLSRDRRHIAFIGDAPEGALATIVTMAADGTRSRAIVFRPATAKISGMRFIEQLRWISDTEIALSGSLNPSTGEYAVIDAGTGKELRDYLVDGFSWAASPDGTHAAYVGYIPHFTPEERRRPQICIDDECGLDQPFRGYPPPSTHVEFSGKPLWSPDGTVVAIAAEDYNTHAGVVIVRPLRGRPTLLSPGTQGDLQLSWDRSTLLVRAGTQAWRLDPGSLALSPVKP